VAELVGGRPRKLLEAVAEDVAQLVLADDRVRQVRVRVTKPQAPLPVDGSVAVEITRDREATGEGRP
jgi:dihydroneopterin aldolase